MGMMIHRRRQKYAKSIPLKEPVVEAKAEEKAEECVAQKSSMTKEDIEKLPYFSLKSLASTYGIDVKDKKTKDLRTELYEKIKEE